MVGPRIGSASGRVTPTDDAQGRYPRGQYAQGDIPGDRMPGGGHAVGHAEGGVSSFTSGTRIHTQTKLRVSRTAVIANTQAIPAVAATAPPLSGPRVLYQPPQPLTHVGSAPWRLMRFRVRPGHGKGHRSVV